MQATADHDDFKEMQRQAMEATDADLIFKCGECYANGFGVERDEREALRWTRLAAEQNHAVAQCVLGSYLASGFGGSARDPVEAVRWFLRAAAEPHCNRAAQFNLGLLHRRGDGVARSDAEARVWFERAAAQGDADALYECGQYALRDDRDGAKAIALWTRAAEPAPAMAPTPIAASSSSSSSAASPTSSATTTALQPGPQRAMCAIGELLLRGNAAAGVCADEVAGQRWLRRAAASSSSSSASASAGNARAQNILGACLRTGQCGMPIDHVEAAAFFQRAADQRLAEAQLNLAHCYAHGDGVAQDRRRALQLYTLAAEQDLPVAQRYLASCLREGVGCERGPDPRAAVRWFRRAAELGDGGSQCALGQCLAQGAPAAGVARNMAEAVAWLRKAAAQNVREAHASLEMLRQAGVDVSADVTATATAPIAMRSIEGTDRPRASTAGSAAVLVFASLNVTRHF